MPIATTNFFNKAETSPYSTSIGAIIDQFKYTLEIVPDLLLVTIGIFAILLQSPSFVALGLSLLSVNLVQPFLSQALREVISSTWAISTRSTGKFPSTSAERVILNSADAPGATLPSYYTMFLGTFLGWIAFLPLYYQPELNYSPQRQMASNVSIAFVSLFSAILLAYRFLASQDTFIGILLGVGAGGVLGFLLMLFLYYTTQRRATNLYNFPLLSASYGGTDPIYVCAPN
jgi:hypothetical protein